MGGALGPVRDGSGGYCETVNAFGFLSALRRPCVAHFMSRFVGVACAAALTTALQNVIMVLLAKRKTGMWTHVMFSFYPFGKALSAFSKGNNKPLP